MVPGGTMIAMSRSGGRPEGELGQRAPPRRRLTVWYGACIALGSGCLYIEPTWQPNMEPEIIAPPDYQTGDEVLLDLGQANRALVVARDPDSARVSCYWDLAFEQVDWTCERVDDSLVTSQVILDYDPDLDGLLLIAHILDDLSAADVQVRFRLQAEADGVL